MKICAVICEFNPFHNGHEYILSKAKQLSGCDAVVCVMSGNFSQRAEPTIFDMHTRTKMALACGGDMVVELPSLYASACGEKFSEGAINIINSIKGVTHLAFGSECGDIDFVTKVAKIQIEKPPIFMDALKQNLDNGNGYASSLSQATITTLKAIYNNTTASEIKPNDILAIEYTKQLITTKSKIKPIAIKRQLANHSDTTLSEKEFSSGTSLRLAMQNNNIDALSQYIPKTALDIASKNNSKPSYELYSALMLNALRNNNLQTSPECKEGLQNRINKHSNNYSDINDLISAVNTKRYTSSRIRRLALQSLLCVTYYPNITNLKIPFRVLGVKKELASKLLSTLNTNAIKRNSDAQDYITTLKTAKKQNDVRYIINTNKTASNVYSIICKHNSECYESMPIIIA